MSRYARMEGDLVAEIIEVPGDGAPLAGRFAPEVVASCVPLDPQRDAAVDVAWRRSPGAVEFLPPVEDDATGAPLTLFSPLEFMARLSAEEQTTLATRAQTDAQVLLVLITFSSASYIDLTDERIKQAIDLLVSKGVLDEARGVEIMTP